MEKPKGYNTTGYSEELQNVIDQIRDSWETILASWTGKAKKGVHQYICPLCGHGKGGDGIKANPDAKKRGGLKCFGGTCQFSGDIIDLWQQDKGVDFMAAVNDLAGQLHIDLPQSTGTTYTQKPAQTSTAPAVPKLYRKADESTRLTCLFDSKEYKAKPEGIWEVRNREPVPTPAPGSYTLEEFVQAVTSGRTFYPCVYNKVLDEEATKREGKNRYNYIGVSQQVFVIDIDNERHDENGKHRIDNPLTIEGAQQICKDAGVVPACIYQTFSSKYHRGDPAEPYQKFRIVFVTQEPITAQEVGELGLQKIRQYFMSLFGEAADTGITDNARMIFGTDEKDALLYHFVIDNQALLEKVFKPAEEPKDEVISEDAKAEYMKTSAAACLAEFEDGVRDSVNTPAISTGFFNLDEALDGGLYEGLYVLGAISSLGKTTLLLQLADNLAQQGHDVLIFSLEMARNELIAKSLSRLTYTLSDKAIYAKTTRGITSGARYANYGDREKALIQKAKQAYAEYAGHIFIHEGMGDIGVTKVREVVAQHIAITGNKPIVLLDYMQILAPYDVRSSDKQNVDKNVLELKRLSRDNKIPVFAISSFNRDSYKGGGGANQGKVSMTDFKESGAVEYSADVLLGLEFDSAGTNAYDERAEKKKDPRQIRLVVLKNRNGKAWETACFDYLPLFNYYRER